MSVSITTSAVAALVEQAEIWMPLYIAVSLCATLCVSITPLLPKSISVVLKIVSPRCGMGAHPCRVVWAQIHLEGAYIHYKIHLIAKIGLRLQTNVS